LTLWYAGIFTVSSFIAFFLFYMLIISMVGERIDQDLLDQAAKFSSVLETQGIKALEDTAILKAQEAGVKKVFFRFLFPSGQVFSSSNMAYWEDIDIHKNSIENLLSGQKPIFETVTLKARQYEVRVLYALIGPDIILQMGQSIENYAQITAAFGKLFLATMALLIALATGVGWFMSRRAVAGVEEITRTARSISGGTLEKRVPVKDKGDEIDELAMTFNQMLDRIQTLVTEIKEMGDNIAHDLKSPLTRIRGTVEITLTAGKSIADYKNMAESTIEECDNLLHMINTMLMISRTEAGVEKPLQEMVDLSSLARDVCELFETTIEDKGLSLNCNIPGKVYINGDTRMIQRLFANLMDNAIKYTPPRGVITVNISEDREGNVTASVEDNGIGISSREFPRIFERFYRGDASRSEVGSGLGLSLARTIARAHGGDITVMSQPGRGSIFTVTLPHAPSPGSNEKA
jgi:heavy metal sensor kinase